MQNILCNLVAARLLERELDHWMVVLKVAA
jgi:hypothetical protein